MNEGWGVDYVKSTYKRWFEQGKEPAIEPNLSEILQELKLNKDEVIAQAQSTEIENKYLENTEKAYSLGVFGSPSFIFDGEVFWGDDRLEDCIEWVKSS